MRSWKAVLVLGLALSGAGSAEAGGQRRPQPPSPILPAMSDWFHDQSLGGHRLTPLPDGPTLMQARKDLLRSARRTLFVSAYQFNSNGAFDDDDFFVEVCRRASEGLEVRVLADNMGTKSMIGQADRLRNCGIKILFFAPTVAWGVTAAPFVLHEKLMIADGRAVILGGSGFGENYDVSGRTSGIWYDMDMLVEGPSACEFQRGFADSWARSRDKDIRARFGGYGRISRQRHLRLYGPDEFEPCQPVSAPGGVSRVVSLHNNPLFSDRRPLLDAYERAIRAVEPGERIRLYAPYFVPTPRFTRALVDAVKRGVQVDILTNSTRSTDETSIVILGTYYTAQKIVGAGGRIWMWDQDGTMHRKGGIFGKYVVYGSDNLDHRGQEWSSESVIFTDDPEVRGRLEAEMDADGPYMEQLTRRDILDHFNREHVWNQLSAAFLRWYM
ncbi:MAG: phosphatidylserine/phosphatidylglycerophosphate/cardiolipin synthase family protein [Bdellovibrionales bacterium]|nr:phosphatidylserine/phosphatidylglycerophosphate/cardiolipin synthase family protein [Bdellovibrionales bacterium]